MPELVYSNDALNVKNSFYRADAVVYVEGDDDLMFWHEIFVRVPGIKVEIEPLGSCSAVDDVVNRIESGELDAIAARDSDYLKFNSALSSSPRVLYTEGYSIENSLISDESMLAAARTFSRNPKIGLPVIKEWITHLEDSLRELLTLDLASYLNPNPVVVLGDNSARFTAKANGHKFCGKKCADGIAAANLHLPPQKVAQAKTLLAGASITSTIRGHFLLSNAQKFLSSICKDSGKSVSISYDSLYSYLILFFSKLLDIPNSKERSYVLKAKKAAISITG